MAWRLFVLLGTAAVAACATSNGPPVTRANTSMDASRIVGPESPEWDTPPKLLNGKAPIYPISQLLSAKTGTSVIVYTIGTDGRPRDFRIDSTTDERYANHAIIAVQKWVYQPALKDGVPVEATVRQSFDFDVR